MPDVLLPDSRWPRADEIKKTRLHNNKRRCSQGGDGSKSRRRECCASSCTEAPCSGHGRYRTAVEQSKRGLIGERGELNIDTPQGDL